MLLSGKSRAVISHNIKVELKAHKKRKQAVAIALHMAGVKKHKDLAKRR